ncbi:CAP domain-containing protein [Paractinoplanes hotanensis]|uniref:CAP domain-containing protein n=1 Tax=Paractinoplanes hotanensis TaxID=2906497 RepID=A0ABT0YG53_9ACTN|nr:CAP domain-containing protein [Actinoplanes hotanensis]MCM4085036.1 CAP domain-containing protein [Actinoplanes hotanensis]
MSAAARFRYTLVAGATAVVIGGGFTVAGLTKNAQADTTGAVNTSVDRALVDQGATEPAPPARSASPSPNSPSPSSTAPTTTPPTSKAPAKKKATSKPRPTATKNKKPATTVPQTSGSVVEQVLAHINAARKAEGRGALSLDTDLSRAAAVHNQLMIDGCGLSHQCSGEKGLGDRFSAQGVKWSGAGENIGYGSSAASDSAQVKAANGLTDSMLAEVPPNDGHRKNLLNPSFKRIGLSIVRDSKGITWMTQDFVN